MRNFFLVVVSLGGLGSVNAQVTCQNGKCVAANIQLGNVQLAAGFSVQRQSVPVPTTSYLLPMPSTSSGTCVGGNCPQTSYGTSYQLVQSQPIPQPSTGWTVVQSQPIPQATLPLPTGNPSPVMVGSFQATSSVAMTAEQVPQVMPTTVAPAGPIRQWFQSIRPEGTGQGFHPIRNFFQRFRGTGAGGCG